MSAYLVFDALRVKKIDLKQTFPVSEHAWKMPGSRMFIDPKMQVPVEDLIKGMIMFINSKDDLTGPVNFGNPMELTIEELAKKIVELTASKSEIINIKLPDDDPTRRKPSIEKARGLLGWEPEIDLNTGLMSTIKYFEKILYS